jgi:hypothetical protein
MKCLLGHLKATGRSVTEKQGYKGPWVDPLRAEATFPVPSVPPTAW